MNRKVLTALLVMLGVLTSFWVLSQNPQSQGVSDETLLTPTEGKEPPDNWETYNSSLKYSISYPDGYVVEPNGDYSILLLKPMDEPGFGPTNFIYVSIVQPNMLDNEGEIYNYRPSWYTKLDQLEIGESRSLADEGDAAVFDEVMTYTRMDDTVIDGYRVKRFENNKLWEFPPGTTEVRYIFEKDGYIYILGYYYGGEGVTDPIDPREAFNIVSSFRLN